MNTNQIHSAIELLKLHARQRKELEKAKGEYGSEKLLEIAKVKQEWQKLKRHWELYSKEAEQWLEALECRIGQKLIKQLMKNSGTKKQFKHLLRAITWETQEEKLIQKAIRQALRKLQAQEILRGIQSGIIQWQSVLGKKAIYGIGMDERVIELPLAIDIIRREQGVYVLDAGAALNLPFLKQHQLLSECNVIHLTQSGYNELPLFEGSQYSYVFGDLRTLLFNDNLFDYVICISTLEHIGMDNSRYGGTLESDPDSYLTALREMYRVLKPTGVLMITVPFGAYVHHGWFQVFSYRHIQEMLRVLGMPEHEMRIYKYEDGWFELIEITQKEHADRHVIPSYSVDQIAVIKILKA